MGKTVNREKIQQHYLDSSPLLSLLIIVIHLTLAKYPFILLSLFVFVFFSNLPKASSSY